MDAEDSDDSLSSQRKKRRCRQLVNEVVTKASIAESLQVLCHEAHSIDEFKLDDETLLSKLFTLPKTDCRYTVKTLGLKLMAIFPWVDPARRPRESMKVEEALRVVCCLRYIWTYRFNEYSLEILGRCFAELLKVTSPLKPLSLIICVVTNFKSKVDCYVEDPYNGTNHVDNIHVYVLNCEEKAIIDNYRRRLTSHSDLYGPSIDNFMS